MPTTLNNYANVSYSYSGAVTPGSVTSNTTLTTLLDEYSLFATKTALVNTFRPGDRLAYVLQLENNGQGPIYNITVSDDLGGVIPGSPLQNPLGYLQGSARLYSNGEPVAIIPTMENNRLVFQLPSPLMPRDNATIVYMASVNPDLPVSVGSITNSATITGNGCSATGAAIPDIPVVSETVVRELYAELSILKEADKHQIVSGETLTYTFTIANSGNIEATPVTLTDRLPANFTPALVSVTINGYTTTYNPGQYNLDPRTNEITLPNAYGPQIIVPAATELGPGIASVLIAGVVS